MTNDYHHLPEIQKVGVVPWFGKTWGEIQRDHMPQVEQHLAKLTALKGKDAAANYLYYLKTMSGRKA